MVLDKVYGFKGYKTFNNGSWDIEQFIDGDMKYTARILSNGQMFVCVETNEKYPKLVNEFEFNPIEGKLINASECFKVVDELLSCISNDEKAVLKSFVSIIDKFDSCELNCTIEYLKNRLKIDYC